MIECLASFVTSQSSMEEVLLRFAHLGDQIFDSLDNKSLLNSSKVSKTWKSFIERRKFQWIRIIKRYDEKSNKNHADCQQKWRDLFQKTKIEDVREFAKGLISRYKDWKFCGNTVQIPYNHLKKSKTSKVKVTRLLITLRPYIYSILW